MNKYKNTILIITTTIGVFLLSNNPITGNLMLQLTLVSIMLLLLFGYRRRKAETGFIKSRRFIFLVVVTTLLLVAATGWFFSPFFFTLYLLALILAFEFRPSVSIGFVAVLVGLFSINIGEVDVAYDFLIILSLVSVIPIALYLRKEYLRLKETEKEILVLRKAKKNLPNTVEDVLANKVNKFSVDMRQPINDIKQIAYHLKKQEEAKKFHEHQDRIIASAEEALRTLKKFEEKTTGKKLLTTPK